MNGDGCTKRIGQLMNVTKFDQTEKNSTVSDLTILYFWGIYQNHQVRGTRIYRKEPTKVIKQT